MIEKEEIIDLGFRPLNTMSNDGQFEMTKNNVIFFYTPRQKQIIVSKFSPNKCGTYDIKKIYEGIVNNTEEISNVIKKLTYENN